MLSDENILKPVETIIWVWSGSLILLTIMTYKMVTLLKRNRFKLKKLRNEEGFAYVLSFCMTIPFMMIIFIAFIEATLVLITFGGVYYSAYATARAAIVWQWAEPAGVVEEKIELAAVHALAPFASSNPTHLDPRRLDLAKQDITYTYCNTYFKYFGDGPASDGNKISNNYLVRKLYYTRQGMKYYYNRPTKFDSIIKATVIYEHPFHFPFIGRALGKPSSTVKGVRVYELKASSSLQFEGAKTRDHTLGIHYDSDY